MRISRKQPFLSSLILLPSFSAAITLDCKHVAVGGHKYDFSALGGPRSVTVTKETPPTFKNTTYTIDLCSPIKRHKNIPAEDECHGGARVCGIITANNPAEGPKIWVDEVYDIAGEYTTSAGASRALDPKKTRLKSTDSDADGVRLELHGGRHPWIGGRKQQAVIEMICDHDRTGLEGLETKEEKEVRRASDDEEEGGETKDQSLIFKSYGAVDDIDVLRLDWLTKYACEDVSGDDGTGSDRGSHWGFFTWFIVILFLGIASYLIFGSWLNYNRYGARGWDLLPHGDTIRDIPYLFKDWMRRVVNTVQGPGSRGGYSAV